MDIPDSDLPHEDHHPINNYVATTFLKQPAPAACPPAETAFQGLRIAVASLDANGRLNVTWSSDGGRYLDHLPFLNSDQRFAPVLDFGGNLYLAWTTTTGNINVWRRPMAIPGANGGPE